MSVDRFVPRRQRRMQLFLKRSIGNNELKRQMLPDLIIGKLIGGRKTGMGNGEES